MKGNMYDANLTTSKLLAHAEKNHGDTEVVSVDVKGFRERTNWREIGRKSRKIASSLKGLGLEDGDRVGTIMPNTRSHLELLYAVSGCGGIAHTINPRLFPDEIVYIINHAKDRLLFVDPSYIGFLIGHKHLLETVEHIYICGPKENEFAAKMNGLKFLEDLVGEGSDNYQWPDLDEDDAAVLCYTSGTTGNPKGVLYSHKSIVIHANIVSLPDSFNISARDTILPIVPMFHVNAWGMTYASAMVGARLVLPGPNLDGKSIIDLIVQEEATLALAIPTIWEEVLEKLASEGASLTSLKRIVSGGSAVPSWVIRDFKEKHGVDVLQVWGMTEISPLGTTNSPLAKHADYGPEEAFSRMESAGRLNWAVEIRIVDDDGNELPRDGSEGRIQVRGPTVIQRYMFHDSDAVDESGWFETGDLGVIDSDGFLDITDRSKDLIKSGGEWISSIELEEIIKLHPDVHDAAVIGVRHEKWAERPVVIAEVVKGSKVRENDLLDFYDGKIVKWQKPDAVIFVDELPLGSTGKPIKRELREQYEHYLMGDQK